ncbi:MAG TPA: hemolysin family protein [Gemmatimonadaceae bacterium]|nr:hemolysin family protein [Gemmatimonadaceae bacterium]
MMGGAWAVAIGGAVLGILCAAADGALVPADEEPPSPMGAANAARVDVRRSHDALATACVILQLIAGAALAFALRLPARPAMVGVVGALVVVGAVALGMQTAPRAYGRTHAAALAPVMALVTRGVTFVARPVSGTSAAIEHALRRAIPDGGEEPADAETIARWLLEAVQAEVPVSTTQRAILRRLLALDETEVREVMTPRVAIVGMERSTPWSEVLDRFRSSAHARLPVYDTSVDEVIGVLAAKRLLGAVSAGVPPERGWLPLMGPATFIPESKTIGAQLRDFRATATQLAIVVDEYGGTAGLVTLEDILEEVVGDIRDEHDRERPPIEVEEGTRVWVAGHVSLEELAGVLQHPVMREDVATVGGLIYDVLGRVPRAGEEFVLDDFRVVVERVRGRRIERVYFERMAPVAERSA